MTNTGNVALKFSEFTDANCSNVSGVPTELARGAKATISCEDKLTATGLYDNEAEIEGNDGNHAARTQFANLGREHDNR